MRSCILHIGTEKSGTTALQEWLYCNRTALSERGLFLSKKLGRPNNRIFPAYFSSQIDEWAQTNKLESLEQKDVYLSDFESSVRNELTKALKSHSLVVISSEHLHSRIVKRDEIQAIHDFLRDIFDQIYVVCYFRNQADMGLSLYSTAMKFGHAIKLEEFMGEVREENYYYNFENIAENWSSVFGIENCIFRIYNRSQLAGADIRSDFLQVCGIQSELSDFDFGKAKSNPSLTSVTATAFRLTNILLPSLPDNQGFVRKMSRLANRALKRLLVVPLSMVGRKMGYPGMGEVQQRFKNSNQRFFEKYFDGVEHF